MTLCASSINMKNKNVIPASRYNEASSEYLGWCLRCKDFTRDCTEPDASEYDCPDCGNLSVLGAENALLSGYIVIDLDEP